MNRTMIGGLLGHATRVAAIGCFAGAAHAQLVAYDGFTNGPLADLAGSAGGAGWVAPWTSSGDDVTTIAAPGLNYVGLATAGGAAVTPAVIGGGSAIYDRTFDALAANTNAFYVSFLLRYDGSDAPHGGLAFATGAERCHVGVPNGSAFYGLALESGSDDLTTTPLFEGETALIVVRIARLVMPAVVTYRLYVNPAVAGPEPGFYDATMWVVGISTLPTSVSIDNGTGFTTDEIRVGTTWASVLPPATSCAGDLDGNGEVNNVDLGILLGAWGGVEGDLNSDGTTGSADLGILLGAWGACP